jgi:ABC-2 type transport system permease protein
MNVAAKTIRDQKKALIGWAIGVGFVVLMYSAFYPSIKANGATFNGYLKSMPKALRSVLLTNSFTTPSGYLKAEIFSIMGPLLLMIFAIGAGARAIAGEEEGGTLDLMLAAPITRGRVALEKFAAIAGSTLGLAAVLLVVETALGPAFGIHVGIGGVAIACLSSALLAIAFGSIAFAAGCWRGRRATAIAVAASLAVIAYILNVLGPSISWLGRVRPLSPFDHYQANTALDGSFGIGHALVLLGIAVVALILGVWRFDRRDIST